MRAFTFTGVSHGFFCGIFVSDAPSPPAAICGAYWQGPSPACPTQTARAPVFRVPCPRKDRSPGTLLAAEKAKQAALKRPAQKRLLFAEAQQEDGRRAVPAVAEGEGEEQVI